MPPDPVSEQMRQDWNRRAREDAGYYVAFGRRNQDPEEFFASAHDQVRGLETELKRLPPAPPRSRRALEIGCGPGRLMRPMSRHFGEIHGVDISEEMIRLARQNLAGVPHAHPHHAPNSNLEAFADSSFDFVYSYAVFQHIPSREVVFNYLRDACRVLKPGGILRCQINGLPEQAPHYDTWSGVRISAAEIRDFARALGLSLLALEGVHTQYMWTTLAKPAASTPHAAGPVSIRRITNAHSSEPLAPTSGRFASLSFWIEGLPAACDLNRLSVRVAGKPAFATYLGHPEPDGLCQLNVLLPAQLPSGLQPVSLLLGESIAASARVRLIPPGPSVPRIVSVTDGIDLLSGSRIVTGTVKLTLEEVLDPRLLVIHIAGHPIPEFEHFCVDPRVPQFEVNFQIPEDVPPGPCRISLALGERRLGETSVEIGA
jgi:SAM-dependent methyltransferase